MKGPSSKEIRQGFVSYFEKNGHVAVPSSSLIPENDATLLFANAGMNQFKNLFLGLEERPYKRAVSVQKCVRAGGKHNDLDNVGFTARHHTFFEMLGNFSFGDYFKKDAIHFAWELLTKEYGIPKEKLYVTVFENDEEAADIWHKQEGVPKDRIFRLGEKDNFWRMGDVGPCGPCTEIFYDHGPKGGRESDPYKGIIAGEDRFVEIWNLVFMQFDEQAPGKMIPLPKPSVDTGSGLERVTAALQGKFSNYDTDLFIPMIQKAAGIAKWDLEKLLFLEDQARVQTELRTKHSETKTALEQLAALRVLADHTRSASLLIADGALPSNEGRGYVLRRIIRRAIRFGRKLSESSSILPSMSEVLITEMNSVYPELQQRRDAILSTLKDEESRFLQTLDQGTQILEQELLQLKSTGKKKLPGAIVFRLYDTFGFPVDLTQVMAAEKGVEIDQEGFDQESEKARAKAKASWKGKGLAADESLLVRLANDLVQKSQVTRFTGYEEMTGQASILQVGVSGSSESSEIKQGEQGYLTFPSTPFYAESGGQAGDLGIISSASGSKAQVLQTTKVSNVHFHHVEVLKGSFKVGETCSLEVGASERRKTAANHSATHLLHAALRKVLGEQVTQAGSLVDSEKLRFDFTYNQPLTATQIEQIEQMVNEEIAKAHPVKPQTMNMEGALKMGALALFGEKYGAEVRVLKMGEFCTELCGGTHVSNTAQIRIFKIVSEVGVSSGVRRIEGLTAEGALAFFLKHAKENSRTREATGIQETWSVFLESDKEPLQWIEESKNQIRKLEKDIKSLKGGQIDVDDWVKKAASFADGSKLICADLEVDDRDLLAQLSDSMKSKAGSGIVVLLGKGTDSHPLVVSVSKDLLPKFSAGNILKEVAAVMGGKGGGRPDFAQGSVPQRDKAAAGFTKVRQMLGVQ